MCTYPMEPVLALFAYNIFLLVAVFSATSSAATSLAFFARLDLAFGANIIRNQLTTFLVRRGLLGRQSLPRFGIRGRGHGLRCIIVNGLDSNDQDIVRLNATASKAAQAVNQNLSFVEKLAVVDRHVQGLGDPVFGISPAEFGTQAIDRHAT